MLQIGPPIPPLVPTYHHRVLSLVQLAFSRRWPRGNLSGGAAVPQAIEEESHPVVALTSGSLRSRAARYRPTGDGISIG
jgi:hypothetical protein